MVAQMSLIIGWLLNMALPNLSAARGCWLKYPFSYTSNLDWERINSGKPFQFTCNNATVKLLEPNPCRQRFKITQGKALELFIKQILQIICFVLRAELLIYFIYFFFNSLKFSLMVPGITCKWIPLWFSIISGKRSVKLSKSLAIWNVTQAPDSSILSPLRKLTII